MTATQTLLPARRPWVERIVRDRIKRPKPDPKPKRHTWFMDAMRRAERVEREQRVLSYLRPEFMAAHDVRFHDVQWWRDSMCEITTVACMDCEERTEITFRELVDLPYGI